MNYKFKNDDIEKISEILGNKPQEYDSSWMWNISDPDGNKPLIISIYNDIDYIDNNISLISVQSRYGYYELHTLTNIMYIEPDEIIFISQYNDNLSCMVIGRNFTCSLFSNINKNLLQKDITTLPPAILMSVMQLSITEGIITEQIND